MMSSETSSKNSKPIRKVKLAIEKSKNHKAGVGTLESKQNISRGSKTSQNRKIKPDDISYAGKNSSHKAKNSGKSIVKSKTKDEDRHGGVEGYEALINENRGFKPMNSGRKRKRIYADHNTGEGRTMHSKVETPGWKALSKVGKNKLKDDMAEEKRTTKVKSHDIQQFARKNSSIGGRISKENEVLDKKCISVSGAKGKAADKIKYFELDGGGNGMLTKSVKSKSPSSKQSDQNENKNAAEFLAKYPKKKVHDKKSFTGDAEVMDGRLKKTKRVIRIDPHDITNKRLDDAIVTNDNSKEKKEDVEKNVEMSKNAQFRAIQPSLSVLSFVEDNVNCSRQSL
ncbi:unnamed protein product [Ilex paraguariensis]|uniref:Uncharacterized protein n=1 Tax=Ilex paraguariensis TaxID=185542 RepID=A0ABC8RD93_9AQUA